MRALGYRKFILSHPVTFSRSDRLSQLYSNTILRTVQTTESFLHGFNHECFDQLVRTSCRTSHLQQKVHRIFTDGESGDVFEQCKWATEQKVLGTIWGNLTLFAQENLFRELRKLEELVASLEQSACGAVTWPGRYGHHFGCCLIKYCALSWQRYKANSKSSPMWSYNPKF